MHTKVLNPIPKAIGIRLSFLALLNLLSISRWAFDSSGSVVLNSADPYKQFLHAHYGLEKYFRWDGLYFAQIASNGYEREQELAFFPLWPLLMRWTGTLVWKLGRSTPAMDIQDVMLGGIILANIASVLAVIAFHKLTSLVIRNSVFAYIATIMYAMHPAPGISSVPYTEPFYALCTFGGSWLLLRQHEQNSEHRSISTMRRQTSIVTLDVLNRLRLDRIIGLLCLMLATGTRSLGILNCVSIGWPSLVRVYREKKWRLTTLVSLVLPAGKCLMVAFPSALFQYQAWVSLCRDKYQTPWCVNKLPLAYSYIQDHYWDVGFLRYWKLAQLPNFAIASPILVLSVYGLAKYGSHLYETPNQAIVDRQRRFGHNDMAFWRNRDILPFFLIHLITTWLVLFASHTQIALRISIANPVIYWTAASLVSSSEADQAKWGRRWLRWTATWGCISIVLWSGFYPPA